MYLIRFKGGHYCLQDNIMDENLISEEEFHQKAREACLRVPILTGPTGLPGDVEGPHGEIWHV